MYVWYDGSMRTPLIGIVVCLFIIVLGYFILNARL